MYTLLITRNDITTNSFLGGSIDVDKITNFIRPAQDKYLINLLGSVLFQTMMDNVGGKVEMESIYVELFGHIKRCLIWYTIAEYIPFSSVQFKGDGAYSINNADYTSPSRNDLDYLMMKALDNAEVYSKRLQDFLIANSASIPEYYSTTGLSNNIYPDGSNQYFSGINL